MEEKRKCIGERIQQYSSHDEAWAREREPPKPINQVAVSVLNQGHEVRLIVPARDNKPCNHPSLLHKPRNYLPIPDRHFRKGKIHLTSSQCSHTHSFFSFTCMHTVDKCIHSSTYVKEKLKVCRNKEDFYRRLICFFLRPQTVCRCWRECLANVLQGHCNAIPGIKPSYIIPIAEYLVMKRVSADMFSDLPVCLNFCCLGEFIGNSWAYM